MRIGARIAVLVSVVLLACGGDVATEFESVGESDAGDGATTSVAAAGGSEEAPELPEALTIPFPEGGIITGTTADVGFAFVTIQYPVERYEEIVDFYRDWIATDSREWGETDASYDDQGTMVRGVTFRETLSSIGVTDCPTDGADYDGACVILNETN